MTKFVLMQFMALQIMGLLGVLVGAVLDLLILSTWYPGSMFLLVPGFWLLLLVNIYCWWMGFCAINEFARRLFKTLVIIQMFLILIIPLMHLSLIVIGVGMWIGSWVVLVQSTK